MLHVGIGDIRKGKGLAKPFDWDGEYQLPGVRFLGSLQLNLKVTNAGSRVMVTGPLRTSVQLRCTRCSEDIDFPLRLNLEEEFLPVHAEEAVSRAQDLLDGTFTFENDRIELDELLRQEIEASFPIQVLCSPDCRGLCNQCGCNLNRENCTCRPEGPDTRWATLENLSEGSNPSAKKKRKK